MNEGERRMQTVKGITVEEVKQVLGEFLEDVATIVVEEFKEFVRKLSTRVIEKVNIELEDLLGWA